MIKTQASVEAAVLKLWGLVCQDCDGITCAEAAKSEPRGVPRCDEKCCKRCGGTGYSLKEATRDTWPWWVRYGYEKIDDEQGWPVRTSVNHLERAVMPDFPTDAAAAMKLAERIAELRDEVSISVQRWQNGIRYRIWLDGEKSWGDTLGAALLDALTSGGDRS